MAACECCTGKIIKIKQQQQQNKAKTKQNKTKQNKNQVKTQFSFIYSIYNSIYYFIDNKSESSLSQALLRNEVKQMVSYV